MGIIFKIRINTNCTTKKEKNMIKLFIVLLMTLAWSTPLFAERLLVPPTDIIQIAKELSYKDFPQTIDILSIIRVESSFNPKAVNRDYPALVKKNPKASKSTSNGIMQVQGGPFPVRENMIAGVQRLREYYERFHSKKKAVIAYNIGSGNLEKGRCQKSGEEYWAKFSKRKQEYTRYNKTNPF
jgi:hypothetical protein